MLFSYHNGCHWSYGWYKGPPVSQCSIHAGISTKCSFEISDLAHIIWLCSLVVLFDSSDCYGGQCVLSRSFFETYFQTRDHMNSLGEKQHMYICGYIIRNIHACTAAATHSFSERGRADTIILLSPLGLLHSVLFTIIIFLAFFKKKSHSTVRKNFRRHSLCNPHTFIQFLIYLLYCPIWAQGVKILHTAS